ncbi:MAG: hypothetical protein NVSMB67_29160 [Flavisolibacter sp.]
MKHLFFVFFLSLSFISFSSFARDGRISNKALESFNNSFKGATDVNWTEVNDYFKASFCLNGQFVTAFYSQEGELVATSRNISSLQLPVTLQSYIKTNYVAYWISDLFEVDNEDGSTFYITIENGSSKIILRSVNSFEWEVFKNHSKI